MPSSKTKVLTGDMLENAMTVELVADCFYINRKTHGQTLRYVVKQLISLKVGHHLALSVQTILNDQLNAMVPVIRHPPYRLSTPLSHIAVIPTLG